VAVDAISLLSPCRSKPRVWKLSRGKSMMAAYRNINKSCSCTTGRESRDSFQPASSDALAYPQRFENIFQNARDFTSPQKRQSGLPIGVVPPDRRLVSFKSASRSPSSQTAEWRRCVPPIWHQAFKMLFQGLDYEGWR